MKSLIRSEWRRFLLRTLLVAVGHFLLLLSVSRVTNLLELGADDQAVMLGGYMFLGLTLALIQLGGYSKPSQWLWLIHRPLSPGKIFGSLALAALAILAVTVALPLLLTVLTYELFTTHVVDARQYGTIVLALGFAMLAWMAGAHATVSRHRFTAAMVLAPVLLALHVTSVWVLWLPLIACLAWFAFITWRAFRADRAAPIARPGVLLLTALPLQLVFLVAAFHLGRGTLDAVSYLTRPPLTIDNQPAAIQTEADMAKAMEALGQKMQRELLTRGLTGSADPRAETWVSQLPLLETTSVLTELFRFPVRHQVSNQPLTWWDEKRGIEWTYSHDRMMFHGRNPRTGEAVGWWGRNGAQDPVAYDGIPLQQQNARTWFASNPDTQTQWAQFELDANEAFLTRPHNALGHSFLLTTDRLLAFRQAAPSSTPEQAKPVLEWSVPLPGGRTHLSGADIAELMDGWLVSFYYFNPHERNVQPWQQVFFVDDAGQATAVSERKPVHGFGIDSGALGAPMVPQDAWWVSPPLHALLRGTEALFDRGQTRPTPFEPVSTLPKFQLWAAGLMVLSALLAYLWSRRLNLSAGRCRLWVVTSALLSLPALLSMLVLEPRRGTA